MGLALDELKSTDESFDNEGVTFLVDKGLMRDCGNIKVDFADAGHRSGFSISSTIPVAGKGGGGCGSGCGSGSCG